MAQNSPFSSSNAVTIGTGAAGQLIADIIKEGSFAPISGHLDDITHMERNNQSMLHYRERLKNLAQVISGAFFRDGLNTPHSEIFKQYFGDMIKLIQRADSLNHAQSQSWMSKIGISRQIPELTAEMDKLIRDLRIDYGIVADSGRVVMPLQTRALLHDIPEIVGEAIKTAEGMVKSGISAESSQAKSIVVYGVRGVGKSLVLQIVYNFYNVSNVFDRVIWLRVSEDYKIPDLQKSICQQIGLDLSSAADIDVRKMHLLANLKNKKFLLILDNLQYPLDLKELGVTFETDNGSKVVFSSRRDFELTEDQNSVEVKPLTTEDGYLLFERVAFKGRPAEGEIMECAKKIAEECQGLPLAIIVVAKAMRPKKTLAEWNESWSQMKESRDFRNLFTD